VESLGVMRRTMCILPPRAEARSVADLRSAAA
jgi:hypothetical protein